MGKFGVWWGCDDCGHDTWVVPSEWDCMDEPIAYTCGGGCETCPECIEWGGDWDDETEAEEVAAT